MKKMQWSGSGNTIKEKPNKIFKITIRRGGPNP
jgi:hypothetical protein